jgi:hypothetical protein
MSSITSLVKIFSAEIICYFKILFEVIIFWNSNFEFIKQGDMKRLQQRKL